MTHTINTPLSIFAELGQLIQEDYQGLIFENIDCGNFVLRGADKIVTFTSRKEYSHNVWISVMESGWATIHMDNKFDANTGTLEEVDWLAWAEDLLHSYKTADHNKILKEISYQAHLRASESDNCYREALERINDKIRINESE
jgi:hypothetical protein